MKAKKLIILVVLGFGLIISCNEKEENNINCSTFDVEKPQLFIKINDATKTNLIENGTINSTNVTIEYIASNISFTIVPENHFGDFNEFDNSLALPFPDESEFQYTINIEGFETIFLDFTAELKSTLCNITFFQPTSVNSNNKEIQLMEFPPQQYLVVIEL